MFLITLLLLVLWLVLIFFICLLLSCFIKRCYVIVLLQFFLISWIVVSGVIWFFNLFCILNGCVVLFGVILFFFVLFVCLFVHLIALHRIMLGCLFILISVYCFFVFNFFNIKLFLLFVYFLINRIKLSNCGLLLSCDMFNLIEDRSEFITMESARVPLFPILGNQPDFWVFIAPRTEAKPHTAINHGYPDMSKGFAIFLYYYVLFICMIFTFIANTLLPIVIVHILICFFFIGFFSALCLFVKLSRMLDFICKFWLGFFLYYAFYCSLVMFVFILGDVLLQCFYCIWGGENNLELLGLLYYSANSVHIADFVTKWLFWGCPFTQVFYYLLLWFLFVLCVFLLYKLCAYVDLKKFNFFLCHVFTKVIKILYILTIFFSFYFMFVVSFWLYNSIYLMVIFLFDDFYSWSTFGGWLLFGSVGLTLSIFFIYFFRTFLRYIWLGEESAFLEKMAYSCFSCDLLKQDVAFFELKSDFYLFDEFNPNLSELDAKIEREEWLTAIPGVDFVDLWGRYYLRKAARYAKNKYRLFKKRRILRTAKDLKDGIFKYWD